MHVCTWQHCGAPATKLIRIRLRHPERVLDINCNPIPDAYTGRDLWRCDLHYEEAKEHWAGMEDVFIVEW